MKDRRTCGRCGTVVPVASPLNLCPGCLLDTAVHREGDCSSHLLPSEQISTAAEPLKGSPVFGQYELLTELGRGGQGVVYRARHRALGRLVALKTIPPAHLAGARARERFQLEARTASRLDHPNIVPIYEVGDCEGFCFYSMKLVEGTTAERLVSGKPPDEEACRRNAAILAKVAQAIHHAHQRGVLHRDVKPSNILLDRGNEPYVSDFGLARQMDEDSSLTVSQAVIGTPAYLAPEIVIGGGAQATVAADIYGLGAVLFYLLTGRPPFAGSNVAEILREAQEAEPPRPKRLNPLIPTDLETICLKCLHKEPSARYDTAEALADDLARFLGNEPIVARPLRGPELVWRWCRRRPLVAGLVASLIVVFFAGLAGVLTQWRRAENESAENRRQVARLNVSTGVQLLDAGDYFKSLLWFVEALRGDAKNAVREKVHRQRIASVLQECPRLVQVISHEGAALAGASFGGMDDRLATVAVEDRTARVWEVPSGRLLSKSKPLPKIPQNVLFSPDGSRLLVLLTDNTVCLLDARTGEFVGKALPHLPEGTWFEPLTPSFDSTGQRLVTQANTNQLQVWDSRTGEAVGKLLVHTNTILRMQFEASGSLLFTRTEGPVNLAWDIKSGELLPFPIPGPEGARNFFLGQQPGLALFGARVWRERGGKPPVRLSEEPFMQEDWVLWAAFSPEGGRLVTAGRDGAARLWDALTGKPLTPLLRHDQAVLSAAFSPDGHRVLTVSKDNQTRVWDADTGEPLTPPIPHARAGGPSAFSPSGRYLLSLHPSYVAYVWDLHRKTSAPALLQPGGGLNEAAARGGAYFAKTIDNLIRVHHATGAVGASLHPISMKAVPAQAWFDESGRFVLLEGRHVKIQVWDTASGMPITPQVQSRYSLEASATTKVKLPTIPARAEDLARLAQLLSGNRLDGTGGWTLLEQPELVSLWVSPERPSASESWPAYIGPSPVSLNHWHRREAEAAEAASDWEAAQFHWRRLAALQPDTPEIGQRLSYTSECAAKAATRSYARGRRLVPPRDPRASARQIDLGDHYTGPIADGFNDARRDIGLPLGLQELRGIAFEVRGLIQLAGREAGLRRITRPERVTGIRIRQTAAHLCFLHAEQWADTEDGEEVASLTVHYASGASERIPIQHGVNIASDWFWPSQSPATAEVAWTGTTELANVSQAILALYLYRWLNPHPDWEIAAIDLVSAKTRASYILVAVTAD